MIVLVGSENWHTSLYPVESHVIFFLDRSCIIYKLLLMVKEIE